jgi:YD repeat-containing protein
VPARTVLVIWTVASELSSPSTVAMTNAAHDALGAGTVVRVEPIPEDTQASLLEEQDASGVVQLVWDEEHRRASMRCYLVRSQRWVDREVTFTSLDPEAERGRTLGFLAASILIDAGAPYAGRRAEPAPPPPVTPVARDTRPRVLVPTAPIEPWGAIGAGASLAGPGDGTSYGGWFSAEYSGLPRFWLGLFGEARFGTLPRAQATSQILSLTLTSTLELLRATPEVWIGVRLGGGATYLTVGHFSEGDPTAVEKSRFVPTFDALLSGAYGMARGPSIYAEAGVNFVPGVTEIFVREQNVATLPRLLTIGRIGLRTTF